MSTPLAPRKFVMTLQVKQGMVTNGTDDYVDAIDAEYTPTTSGDWPGSSPATVQAALDQLAGNSSNVPVSLFDHYANAGNTGTGETDLYADTLAAARLAANGEKIEAEYGGVFVSSATATRRIRISFAGETIFDSGSLTLSLSSAWTCYVTIIRVSSTVIRYMVSFATEGAALSAYTAVGELTGLTLSGTAVLKITGQASGVGAATNDVVAQVGSVTWRPAA